MKSSAWTIAAPNTPGEPPERTRQQHEFGVALSTLRVLVGLTQEELSENSGLSVRTIRNLENGHTERPRKKTCELLAHALDLSDTETRSLLAAAGWGVRSRSVPLTELPQPRSELPLTAPGLVGRQEILAGVCRYLSGDGSTYPAGGGRLAVVTGPPGSGKTALVAHAAQLLREEFPDGQIFIDLDDSSHEPLSPAAVVLRLLRSLRGGEPSETGEERAAALRALLADRRVLVVADNADSEAQIRPLLTGSPGSAVLVAARRQLWALPQSYAVELDPLSPEEAVLVLENLLGRDRTATEPSAVQSIALSCGHLPLSLHVAGLWIAARPHRRLRELADRLVDEKDRLDTLRVGDLSLRASVAAYFRRLAPAEQEALHRLGALRGYFDVGDAATALGVSRATAADLIDDLTHHQMIWLSGPTSEGLFRYQLHDSVRLYASWAAAGGAY
ncbi:helix-turn-helix domain-containing protein [Actinacidiphila sp. ITFR-21]|uniref:helix-turn-helix domain-containing protein n=1 Tax=Actinacidiphila sp. ITFR-21 TaxID=3075199 RepID=UPI00288A290B|nr:helix-turn-helix domain-containing protein [Streptomyces sp. ITFR-21]WNI18970.1 helix-turn-helix domain-containing protein [Streptomyces sp. ITFR-21]